MRLKLADLFVIVAYCAVLAWAAAKQGVAEPGFWIATIVTASMTAGLVWTIGSKNKVGLSLLIFCAAPSCVCIPIFPPAALVTLGLLSLVAVWFACGGKLAVRRLAYLGMGLHAFGTGLVTLPFMESERRQRQLLERYPAESLAQRLPYEPSRPSVDGMERVVLPSELDMRLVHYDDQARPMNRRGRRLAELHSGEFRSFAERSGFGVGRARVIEWNERLELPPLENIHCDETEFAERPKYADPWRLDWFKITRGDKSNAFDVHRVSQLDFLHPVAFGAVMAGSKRVAGFVSHAFHNPPPRLRLPNEMWIVRRLELVSLLRFDNPRVYVLDHLPRMDQLSSESVPTRELDDFEATALVRLHRDDDVVLDEQPTEIRMLGALRASNECRNCHEVRRGELLGAFTYRIQPCAP